MYQSSEAFGNLIQQDSRTFHARITLDGQTITDGIMKITMDGGSNSENDFSIGSAVSQYVEITLEKGETLFEGHELYLEFGMEVDGVPEYIPMGYFTAEKPETDDNQISFTAYDRMIKMEQTCFLDLPEATNTIAVLNGISEITGVQVVTDGLKAYPMKLPEGYTCREVLSYISQMYGGFVVCNRAGQIEIRQYEDCDYTVPASRYWNTFTHNDYLYSISKITCFTGTDDEGGNVSICVGDGGTREISFSNPYMTQEALDDAWKLLKEFTYMPGEVKFLGDPRIDPWDILTIEDRSGESYKVPAMQLTQDFDGGLSTTIKAVGKTETEQSSGFTGPTTRQMDRYYAQLVLINKAVIDKASIKDIEANYAKIDDLKAISGKINDIESNSVTTKYLETEYAKIDLTNIKEGSIKTAMIGTGAVGTAQIADGSITDAKIVGLTANKITAGTIDATNIEVVNLNAANITVGTINGQQIASGAIDMSKLSDGLSDTITATQEGAEKALQDAKTANDGLSDLSGDVSGLRTDYDKFVGTTNDTLDSLQDQIDGAIETFTGSTVPTLANVPAVNWTTEDDRNKHVGDLYIVNADGGDYAGFLYRFMWDVSNGYYWVNVPDSEVSKAIKDAADAQEKANAIASDLVAATEQIAAVSDNLSQNYSTTDITSGLIEESNKDAKSYTDGVIDGIEVGARNLILLSKTLSYAGNIFYGNVLVHRGITLTHKGSALCN